MHDKCDIAVYSGLKSFSRLIVAIRVEWRNYTHRTTIQLYAQVTQDEQRAQVTITALADTRAASCVVPVWQPDPGGVCHPVTIYPGLTVRSVA